ISSGGLKLWDKETNKYATAARTDDILKKAYADIKYEGGAETPFSSDMRTFEFQGGQPGADAWKRLQAKYGTGNEIMRVLDEHIDHMSSTIALHEIFGPTPQAAFEAAVRLAKEKNPGEALGKGLRYLDSELAARNTFNEASGSKGYSVGNIGNEVWARRMSGVRQILGAVALRNLPISIVPSDAAMTFLAAHHDGMSGLDIMRHTFDGKMTRQEAAHLEIAAHSYQDFIANKARRYSDEINVSGLARAVPNFVVKATGADLWTRNLRLGYQLSYFHKLADFAELPWNKLPDNLRNNFFAQYGITSKEWDQIRAIPPDVTPNGAKYVDLPELTKANRELSERLQRAVGERSSYGAHQPDARTRAIAQGNAIPGTLAGEAQLGFAQYKQFALERMSTHLLRTLYEGTGSDRVKYGIAFTLMSMAAGAVSLQAAAVLAGKNPLDMYDPHFWIRAFAKGGAGGVYGDLLSEALTGNVSAGAGVLGGPTGGLIADVTKAATAPLRHELFDKQGQRATSGAASEIFSGLKRWTPSTWYTKLAVDRFFWEQLQALMDPHWRDSFKRANQAATKKGGTGYWFGPGAAVQ
ncbi:MAG TPA: hypothetical protein VFN27_16555, partial [Xanthobacteraceae bacterium]|nr:hypothetical protein [Xanthobacteraceae bacterium]